MSAVILTDNTKKQNGVIEGSYENFRKDLDCIAGKRFSELSDPKSGFIVFPPVAKDADLKENDVVLNIHVNGKNISYDTGNVMGFFGVGKNAHFQIRSRFDKNSGNKNYFLHYMLQKICNVAYTPRTTVGEDSFFDFPKFRGNFTLIYSKPT